MAQKRSLLCDRFSSKHSCSMSGKEWSNGGGDRHQTLARRIKELTHYV
ncbi:hypothetical protein [Nostoc sp.]